MSVPYNRFFAAQRVVERLEDEIKGDLRGVGERYMKLKRELAKAQGNSLASYDMYPQTVTSIELWGKEIHVSGYWSRRGCIDPESCTLPVALVFGTDEERDRIFAQLQTEIDEANAETERMEEAEKRAEYEELKKKFEGGQ